MTDDPIDYDYLSARVDALERRNAELEALLPDLRGLLVHLTIRQRCPLPGESVVFPHLPNLVAEMRQIDPPADRWWDGLAVARTNPRGTEVLS